MEKWICSCGNESTGNFCGSCGQPRPIESTYTEVVENVTPEEHLDGTIEIPAVPEEINYGENGPTQIPMTYQQPGMVNYGQPFGGNQGGYQGVPQSQQSIVDRIGKGPLIAIAVVLVAAIIGLIVYFTGMESRYLDNVNQADQAVTEAHTVLTEIRAQNGDPDADATKAYIAKLNEVKDKVDKAYKSLSSAKPGKKYQDYNVKLVDALGTELQILQKVSDTVTNTPDNPSSAAIMDGSFQVDVQKLSVMSGDVNLENTHFATSMKLDTLTSDMNTYLEKFHQVAVRKRIEAEQKRRQEALNRLNVFRQKMRSSLPDRRSEAYNNGKYTYLVTDVYPDGTRLMIDGEIYNGERKSYNGFNNYTVTVTLYNEGNQVYQASGKFSGHTGNLYGGSGRGYKFWFYGEDIRNVVYDSFEVTFG